MRSREYVFFWRAAKVLGVAASAALVVLTSPDASYVWLGVAVGLAATPLVAQGLIDQGIRRTLIHLLRAPLYLLGYPAAAIAIGSLVFWVLSWGGQQSTFWGMLALTTGVAYGILMLVSWCVLSFVFGFTIGRRKVEKSEDISRSARGEYALIIRPFWVDRQVVRYYRRQREYKVSMAEWLTKACMSQAVNLRQIGRNAPLTSGSMITSDADWRKLATVLIENAGWILVAPSDRDGTLWELHELERLFAWNRVIIFLPRDVPMTKPGADDQSCVFEDNAYRSEAEEDFRQEKAILSRFQFPVSPHGSYAACGFYYASCARQGAPILATSIPEHNLTTCLRDAFPKLYKLRQSSG